MKKGSMSSLYWLGSKGYFHPWKKKSSMYLETISEHWQIAWSHLRCWFVMPASPADCASDPAQKPQETQRCEALYQCSLAPSQLFLFSKLRIKVLIQFYKYKGSY